VPVPFKANIALKTFELYATGTFSYKSLAKRMKTDYGVDMPWSSFGTILKNRFYIGEIYDKATDNYYQHHYEQFVPYELPSQNMTRSVLNGVSNRSSTNANWHGSRKLMNNTT